MEYTRSPSPSKGRRNRPSNWNSFHLLLYLSCLFLFWIIQTQLQFKWPTFQSIYQQEDPILKHRMIEKHLPGQPETYPPPYASYHGCYKHCNLKIYIYKTPSKFHEDFRGVTPQMFDPTTNKCQHCHEYIVHDLLMQTKYIQTEDPEEADLFFVPYFSGTLYLRQDLWKDLDLDEIDHELLEWLEQSPYWNRNFQRDHFFIDAYSWSTSFWDNHKRAPFRRSIRISSDSQWPGYIFENGEDWFRQVVVPFLGCPELNVNRTLWQMAKASNKRKYLATFLGSTEIDASYKSVRLSLLEQFREYGKKYEFDAFEENADLKLKVPLARFRSISGRWLDDIFEPSFLYMNTIFCPVPAGDTAQTKRLTDTIAMLCIPVVISNEVMLPFASQIQWKKFAIFIKEQDLIDRKIPTGNLLTYLLSIPQEEIKRRQQELLKVRQLFAFPPYLTDDLKEGGDMRDGWTMLLDDLAARGRVLSSWRGFSERNYSPDDAKWAVQNQDREYDIQNGYIEKEGEEEDQQQ